MDLTAALFNAGIVPVVTLARPEDGVPVAEALLAGGLTCVEITFRSAAAPAAIAAIRTRVPALLVGAGTILTTAQADEAIAAGASFLVAPGFNPAVVDHVLGRGVPMLPGVCTPSEIEQALARGLTLVKFFPAAAMGGVGCLRALAGPYPMMRYVPTGGITPEDVAGYLALGSVVATGGTWLAPHDVVAAGAWETITALASGAAAMVRQARDADAADGSRAAGMSLPTITPRAAARWDLVALGEVMLRLDPGEERIHTTRTFRVWEGGGEYNVARALRRCFGLRTTIVTALADNQVGRLVEDLILQGGVDLSHLRWAPYDGVGRTVRNGLNFTERGFGVRAAVGMSDRGLTAASQMRPAEVDWDALFGEEGARWFHTGGIFAALSDTTADVAAEAMAAAHRHGAIVSYDLNYRPSLWKGIGGQARAQEVNRALAPFVDVMLGNEEDFTAALGFDVAGLDANRTALDPASFGRMMSAVTAAYPNIALVATTLRVARTASRNDWGALCFVDGELLQSRFREGLEILDRVGGGDSFASGLIYGLLAGFGPGRALEYGAAHGALAMTTPGDTSSATLAEVEAVIAGASARVDR